MNSKRIHRWFSVAVAALCVLLMPAVLSVRVSAASCAASDLEKSGNLAIIYGIVALLAIFMVAGYALFEKKREKKFLFLYICVALVNIGYLMQALSRSVFGAMLSNRISYFGAAFSILMMLLIIFDVCQIHLCKWKKYLLFVISTAAFILAASGTWLGLYYRQVDIESVNGMTKLVKVYGPLHILYTVYLMSYVIIMVTAIVRTAVRKKNAPPKYAVFLAAIVLGNIGVWAVEQFIEVDFEFLSVSYIITEVLLLLIYGMLRDYGIVQPGGMLVSAEMLNQLQNSRATPGALPPHMEELFDSFAQKATTLSSAERRILNYYIEGHEIADVPELACISINTVKKHNRSIYQKLEVASRDDLMLYIELFRCCGRLSELTDPKE